MNTQPSNQMSNMNTQSFEQFNSPLSAPVNVLAGEATMSNMNTQPSDQFITNCMNKQAPKMFNVSSMNNISHPIANQSYLSMMYSNDTTSTNDQFTMNALPHPQ